MCYNNYKDSDFMIIKKNNKKIKYLYHYTLKENINSILSSGVIKSDDKYTFFTDNYYKSISLFENEMMSNKIHITNDRVIKRRNYANPDDYRIIKIPYYNDGKFVKMIFDNEAKDSIYNVSTIHEGNVYFDRNRAEVLDIPVQSGNLIMPKIFTKFAFLVMTFINPICAKADTWLDNETYYSTSWFNPNTYDTTTDYTISTASELAGLSYLSNTLGYTFEGKDINFSFPYSSSSLHILDATDHDWVYLAPSFKGRFENRIFDNYGETCGYHRLIIGTEDKGQVNLKEDNQCIIYNSSTSGGSAVEDKCSKLNFTYPGYYKIISTTENGTVSLKRKASVGDKTIIFELIPDYGYTLDSYSVKDSSNNNINVTVESNNKYSFKMPRKNVTITASFKKSLFTITINSNHATIDPEGPLEVEYLNNQSFVVRADIGYEVKGYQINDGEIVPINDSQFIVNVDQNMIINVVVEPIDYTIIDERANNKYIFAVKEDFDEIREVNLCNNNICNKLSSSEYKVENKKITILKDLKEGQYTLKVTFSNERVSSIDFSVLAIINPTTKTNIILLLSLSFIVIFSIIIKKKKKLVNKWKI